MLSESKKRRVLRNSLFFLLQKKEKGSRDGVFSEIMIYIINIKIIKEMEDKELFWCALAFFISAIYAILGLATAFAVWEGIASGGAEIGRLEELLPWFCGVTFLLVFVSSLATKEKSVMKSWLEAMAATIGMVLFVIASGMLMYYVSNLLTSRFASL